MPYDQVQDELKAEFRKSIQKLSTNYAIAVVTSSVEVNHNPKNYGDVAQLFRITAYVLTLNRPGFLESSTAGGRGGRGRIPPPLCNFLI